MKKLLSLALAALLGLSLVAPELAEARRVRVVHRGPHRRTVVVVRPGHPIRRAMHTVVYRRPNVVVRVAPAIFLPLVFWHPVVVVRPAADAMAWQDAETLFPEEDWAETVFDSDQRGRQLFLEVQSGKVQFDFAEVVFENGDTQVVDFANGVRGPGFYLLLDFKDGRKVDHVRLIARAKSDESRIALVMEK
jgi:hypothetical protein